jgi:hypothetical protein
MVLAAFVLPCRAEQSITSTETIIRLSVQPMSAPRPALRYLLLPELKEMSPGNPIPNYVRCVLALEQSSGNPQAAERRERLLAMPLDKLPARELREYGGATLRLVDRAARMDAPDWQLLPKLRADGIGLLLPDLQKMRMLAQELRVRFRAEVALRRFDDALTTAKTMFAMARHMEHPTLIGDLVGVAIASQAIGPLEEMLEQPGCPNLYWALTDLPNPLVPWQRGMEGERMLMASEFHDLDDTAPMSDQQIKALVAHINKVFGENMVKIPGNHKTVRAWLAAQTRDEGIVRSTRGRLVEGGYARELVKQFPPAQVILLEDKQRYEYHRDEGMKLMNLPVCQMEALAGPWKSLPFADAALFDALVPAVVKFRRAPARLEQRLALLRCIEALRLYAAGHDGQLPDRLAHVGVPLPDDPFTGKPFRYRRDGATAHVRGSPPPGEEKNPVLNVRYEVTVRVKSDK